MREPTLWIGPVFATLGGLVAYQGGMDVPASWTVATAILCAIWWIFTPIAIPVTACIPMAVLPLSGALTLSEVSRAYGNPLVMLLLGGFMLSTALAHNQAHERLAIGMVRLFGGNSSRQLVFGFMAAAAALSMWISNTATTLMLMPVAMAVLERTRDTKLAPPLLMGIAYAANIGGVGTPIGTPPNLVFMQVYTEHGYPEVPFFQWMLWALPIVIIMVPCIGFWLTRSLDYQGSTPMPESRPWSPPEQRVLFVFGIAVLAWITRTAPFGGWKSWFDLPYAHDSHVALLVCIAMFLMPNGRGERLLTWEVASKIPWGMLLLFSGGITLATAFRTTGLSETMGHYLADIATWHVVLVVATIALSVTFLTEMTSNLATTTLLMPILIAAAIGADINPLLLMVPAAISASCAFMLPVATAPNTIVYATERFPASHMAREGLVLNFIGAMVITTVCTLFFGT